MAKEIGIVNTHFTDGKSKAHREGNDLKSSLGIQSLIVCILQATLIHGWICFCGTPLYFPWLFLLL